MNTLPIKLGLLEEIIDRIQSTVNLIEHLNKVDIFDHNRMIEDYVLGILNIVYSMEFINLNDEKKNFPALDLGDRKNRIGVQVTTNNERAKITETLKKFFAHELDKEFDIVWILIFGKKKNYKSFDCKDDFDFNRKKHIIDISDLEVEIKKKDEDALKTLNEYLNRKHGDFESQKAMSHTDKMTRNVNENFISRKWIPTEYLNSTNSKIQDYYLWPAEVIKKHNKIVIVCDAGFGKTEEANNLTNTIGGDFSLKFPFFYNLSTFDKTSLVDLVREVYPMIPFKNIVFILDGFDELGDRELKFRVQLEELIKRHPLLSVVLTSRSSHFDGEETLKGNTFEGFSTFQIAPFTDPHIHQYLAIRKADPEKFFTCVYMQGYYEHIRNAFFMVNLVELFIDEGALPEANTLFERLVSKSIIFDKTHYRTVINKEQFDDMNQYLMAVGFISYAVDKRRFEKRHLKAIFKENTVEELFKHVTIWQKVEAKQWYFIHNNFAEYLAAKFLSILPFEDYKTIISTGDEQNHLVPRWNQVMNFLLTLSQDKALMSWITENNLSLLGKADIHHLDDTTKDRLFFRYFEEYRIKRTFMMYDVVKNIIKASIIYSPAQIQYLLDVISKNAHFTIVHNSLHLMESVDKLYGMKEQVRKVLSELICSEHYRNYEKKDAVTALADHNLITEKSLFKYIKSNIITEDQYLRSGYFYAIWTLNLSDIMIDYLIDSYDKVNYRSKHATNLVDQHMNYEKAVGQLRKISSIEKAIEKVREIADRYESASNLVNGLIIAIKNMHNKGEYVNELIYKLYFTLSEEFDSSLNDVVGIIEEFRIGKGFIIYMLNDDSKRTIHQLDTIIDEVASDYIVSWYQSEQYDYDDARQIILNLTLKNPFSVKIFEAHKLKTGEDRIAQLAGYKERNECNKRAATDILKVIFDQEEAQKAIQEFLDNHTQGQYVKVDKIVENRKNHRNEYSEFDRLLVNFIIEYFDKDKDVEPNLTDFEDRDFFILRVQYYKHRRGREYKLEGEYLNKLKHICFERIGKYKEKPFVSIVNGTYKGVFYEAIYLSYFFYVYKFEYPIYFLKKMLLIDRRYYSDHRDFYKVLNKLSVDESRDYIEHNITHGYVHGDTLKYHVDFCLENKMFDLVVDMEKYLELEEDEFVGKKAAVEYILEVKGTTYFMNNHYDKLQGILLVEVDNIIAKKDSTALIDTMKNKYALADEEQQQLYALKMLIRCNNLNGLEEYLFWIQKNRRSYKEEHGRDTINDAVGDFKDITGVPILAEICALMLWEKYDDDDFDNLYRNAKAALSNIAAQSEETVKYVHVEVKKVMNNYDHVADIGFMNHILDDTSERSREVQSVPLTFRDALEKYKELEDKRNEILLNNS